MAMRLRYWFMRRAYEQGWNDALAVAKEAVKAPREFYGCTCRNTPNGLIPTTVLCPIHGVM